MAAECSIDGRMDAHTLCSKVVELAPTHDPARAFALGEAEWPEMQTREATAADAEVCRLISLSASVLGDYEAADLWRERARVRGEAVGWPEMIAALNMSEAFKALSVRNDDYIAGRTLDVIQGSPEALEAMRRLEAVAESGGSGIRVSAQSPSVELIRRFVFEKTGSFQLALRQYDAAVESFAKAVAVAEDPRGLLKTRAGLALALYCRALGVSDSGTVESAIAETQSVAAEAAELSRNADVAETALHNAETMSRQGRDLLLYEIL